jgi:hypothetical protein
MIDHNATMRGQGELRMHWIEVADPSGRTRLEARWSVDTPSHGSPAGHSHANHAA